MPPTGAPTDADIWRRRLAIMAANDVPLRLWNRLPFHERLTMTLATPLPETTD